MCFGGGSTRETTQSTDLPEWAKPYFERNIARSEAEFTKPYEGYTGQRIADTSPATLASRQAITNMAGQGISGLPQAQGFVQQGMAAAGQLGDYNPTQFSEFDFTQPATFTGDAVGEYMSPYMQNVVDVQKDQAILDFDRQRGSRNAQAVQAGAFGGSRQGVQEALAEEALGRNLATIQASGQQKAFESAGTQFGADRAAAMTVDQQRAAELGRVQTGTEAAQQFGAGQGLAALEVGQGLGSELARLGELERQTGIQNAQLLEGVGAAEMSDEQRRLDIDYQNFLEQQGYTRQQISDMSGILAGQPVAATGTSVNQTPGPGALQQIAGAGLTGLSLYKAFQ